MGGEEELDEHEHERGLALHQLRVHVLHRPAVDGLQVRDQLLHALRSHLRRLVAAVPAHEVLQIHCDDQATGLQEEDVAVLRVKAI